MKLREEVVGKLGGRGKGRRKLGLEKVEKPHDVSTIPCVWM